MSKAKKRKTRKEKVLADLHRKIRVVEENTPISTPNSLSLNSKRETTITKITKEVEKDNNLNRYPHLMRDIRKTTITTASILAFQIILFIVLKFQVIKLPGIIY